MATAESDFQFNIHEAKTHLSRLVERAAAGEEIDFEHAITAGALPRHHDDAFDRMLVAQAQREGLALMTSDARIARYAVAVLPAS